MDLYPDDEPCKRDSVQENTRNVDPFSFAGVVVLFSFNQAFLYSLRMEELRKISVFRASIDPKKTNAHRQYFLFQNVIPPKFLLFNLYHACFLTVLLLFFNLNFILFCFRF